MQGPEEKGVCLVHGLLVQLADVLELFFPAWADVPLPKQADQHAA